MPHRRVEKLYDQFTSFAIKKRIFNKYICNRLQMILVEIKNIMYNKTLLLINIL